MRKLTQKLIERIVRAAVQAGMVIHHLEVRPDGTLVLYSPSAQEPSVDGMDGELQLFRRLNGYS